MEATVFNAQIISDRIKNRSVLIAKHFPPFSDKRRKLRKLWNTLYNDVDWQIFLLIAAIEDELQITLHNDLFDKNK